MEAAQFLRNFITAALYKIHTILAYWLNILEEDKRVIFSVASHVQQAADYLRGLQGRKAS